MDRREFLMAASAAAGLLVISACGGAKAPAAEPSPGDSQEAQVFAWKIGARGGAGSPDVWEPKRIEVPAGKPFKLRFMPGDNSPHTIAFGAALAKELGQETADMLVDKGLPAETPVLRIKSANKSFDVFCREHRGIGGFGTIFTA